MTVWFRKKDVPLATSPSGQINKGLRMSRIKIVSGTPAMLDGIIKEGLAQQKLPAPLFTDRTFAIARGTMFEALPDASPLLDPTVWT
ncbi:MAG: hypothetical protein J0I95_03115 [Microbacterium sp.]|uniref:hypothetical protein n=1 Tax=unclassified Microbacterium TaxID=2609290 RepID=UPI001AD22FA2|nr:MULTISPECIES: hypothetical protein [unclassified Microbacterium]MBN9210494.1 hypothetical protein [Microbacterium sp.]